MLGPLGPRRAPWGGVEPKGRRRNWFDQAVPAGPCETLGKADLGPEEEEEVGSRRAGFSMDGEQPRGGGGSWWCQQGAWN